MVLCCVDVAAGRDLVGARRFGPRPLDLDIIFYGNQDLQHEVLSVPHIRWAAGQHCQHCLLCTCVCVHAYKQQPCLLQVHTGTHASVLAAAAAATLCTTLIACSWQDRAFVKAPIADLLLPEDIQRGYIREPAPQASVLEKLLTAVQQWEAEGGEAQVTLLLLLVMLHISCLYLHHTINCRQIVVAEFILLFNTCVMCGNCCCRWVSQGCVVCCRSTGRSGS
jgi:7,8-dihydro-6-hydroxymethylpterin-pyrophosphokinase